MKPLKEITVLWIDRGLFCEGAVRMAKDVKRMLYHCPNDADPFPVLNASMIGRGMEGVEVVESLFGPHFKDVDLFVYSDVGMSEEQEYLRSIGKKVWGCGAGGELEQDRPFAKEMLRSVGLPVGPHKVIKGVKKLTEYLKDRKDQFVKVSRWRGSTESFKSPSFKKIEPHLEEMGFRLGPLKEIMQFDVEDALPDKCEVGVDTWMAGGKLPKVYSIGLEVKDENYAMHMMKASDMPKPIQEADEGLAKILKQFDYQGFVSTEVRIGKDQKPYLIDLSCRHGHPPGFLQMYLLKNYSEIIWGGANGECIEPEFDHAYGVQLQVNSVWSDKEQWQPIDFDPKFRDQIKITNPLRIGNHFYCTPLRFGLTACCAAVGTGNSFREAAQSAVKAAKTVEGYMLDADENTLEENLEACEEARKLGIDLGIK